MYLIIMKMPSTAFHLPSAPHQSSMRSALILLMLCAVLCPAASCHPQEARGAVTRIVDGATFYVSSVGCVRLADVWAPMANTPAALQAREYTRDNLMGAEVFLDIDNQTGMDSSGCWMCVVYMAGANGTVNLSRNFNKMFVQAGFGMLRDDPATEFDPQSW